MRSGVIPGDIDGPRRVFLQECFQERRDLFAALVPLQEHHRFPTVLVHGSTAVVLGRLSGGGNHHRLSLGAPHRPQRGEPTEIELIRVIEDIPRFPVVAGRFTRLFLSAYSGSGLLIVCWGRLNTISAAWRWTRTVAFSTRIPVRSANASANRCSVQVEEGRSRRRGRRRTSCSNWSR